LWRALTRAQSAAAARWKLAPPPQRQDAHKEKHFRTAVQRLKPPRWTKVNVKVFEEIYLWRDRTARRLDEGVSYICSGDVLIDVALALPITRDSLRKVSIPVSPVLGDSDTPEAVELLSVIKETL
ncbi:unnamed protein product, partial [Choristocarpus tenellus]